MICETCGDRGMVGVPWTDAPDDYAVCLCPVGQGMRRWSASGFSLWQVWAAREQVDPSRVFLLEEICTETELKARGFSAPNEAEKEGREAALLSAGKARKR